MSASSDDAVFDAALEANADREAAIERAVSELGLGTEDAEATVEMLADRERYLAHVDAYIVEAPPLDPDIARAIISDESYALIVQHETGGRAYYERVYKSRPVWPGYSSGVTIGFGYDLGYHTLDEFRTAWGELLTPAQMTRLAEGIGRKGQPAKAITQRLLDITVPWGLAEAVFLQHTLPKFVDLTARSLANFDQLHPHAAGSLVSLVFNRGADFSSRDERRREMRQIREAMARPALEPIPDYIRSMKRLWTSKGLRQRRDEEAKLFERGIEEARVAVAVAQPPPAAVIEAPPGGEIPDSAFVLDHPTAEDDWNAFDEQPVEVLEGPDIETPGRRSYRVRDVAWAKEDGHLPDFRHLGGATSAAGEFTFEAADFEILLAANRFKPHQVNGKILFGLRGASLVGSDAVTAAPSLRLKIARPDHVNFRCVIGVYDAAQKTLSGFIASTVPNAGAVHSCWSRAQARRELQGNMLLTGCYGYIVGPHITGSSNVPGSFLLREAPSSKRRVVVLRSKDDVTLTVHDFFHDCRPGDNIHPAFQASTAKFSSLGCQTIRGNYSGNTHQQEWAQFRLAAGLNPQSRGDNGKRYDYVLLTGLEAKIAAEMRASGEAADGALITSRLGRLRQGSQGSEVEALQKALGIALTGTFGPAEAIALAAAQKAALGFSDGIHSPEMDRLLGFNVFGTRTGDAVVAMRESGAPALPRAAPARPRSASPEFNATVAQARLLLQESPDALILRLGTLTEQAKMDPRLAGDLELATEVVPESLVSDVAAAVGQRVYGRLEGELFRLICGSNPEDESDRNTIKGALQQSLGSGDGSDKSGIVLAVAGTLMSVGAAWYAPAIVVGTIFAQRLAKVTLEETCLLWREERQAARQTEQS